jgi:hypothetical protein
MPFILCCHDGSHLLCATHLVLLSVFRARLNFIVVNKLQTTCAAPARSTRITLFAGVPADRDTTALPLVQRAFWAAAVVRSKPGSYHNLNFLCARLLVIFYYCLFRFGGAFFVPFYFFSLLPTQRVRTWTAITNTKEKIM